MVTGGAGCCTTTTLRERGCMAMRRIFPAAKFIPPRSSTHKRPVSKCEERKPLVFEEPTSVATAPATKRTKGKLPHTTRQQWHKPTTTGLVTTTSTGACRHRHSSAGASVGTTAALASGGSVCHHNSSSKRLDESPGLCSSEKQTLDGGSRSTPSTPATRKSESFILAMETPDRRGRPLPTERRCGSNNGLKGVGRLRIPDTPEDLELRLDDAQTSASTLLKSSNGGSIGKSSSSESTESPLKNSTLPVHEEGTSDRACDDHERPSAITSHSTRSDTEPNSLHLRAYASSSSSREISDTTSSKKLEGESVTRCSNDPSRNTPSWLSSSREGLKSLGMVRVALDGQGGEMTSSVSNAKPHATNNSEPGASSSISLQQSCVVARDPPASLTTPATACAVRSVVGTFSNAASFNSPQGNLTQDRASGGRVSPNSITPPERRFEKRHQLLYKSAGGPGRGSRCRGRGRGGGRGGGSTGNGNWAKRRSLAPQPAHGRLLGSWRTERGGKGKPSRR